MLTKKIAGAAIAVAMLAGAAFAQDNGVVKGSVKFEGQPPKMKKIKMDTETTCKAHHDKAGGTPRDESVVVNANNTLKNVVVYVKSGLTKTDFPAPTEPVVLDQKGCQYQPHVFTAMVGQPVKILNSDEGVLHNIHAFSDKSNGFNKGMPGVAGLKVDASFKDDEVVKIKCDVHGWMICYAVVLKHPFSSVSNDTGAFEIKGLPAGEYEIEAWHEKYGTKTEKVKVGAGESKDVAFSFSDPSGAPAEGAPASPTN
jgi:plastocyanin